MPAGRVGFGDVALPGRGLTRADLFAGGTIGVTIFLGGALQAYGLQCMDGSTSAFPTGLYLPAVPLIQWIGLRRSLTALT